jgi:hypothetical protein
VFQLTVTNAFTDSFRHNRPDVWLKKKSEAIQKEIKKVAEILNKQQTKNETVIQPPRKEPSN